MVRRRKPPHHHFEHNMETARRLGVFFLILAFILSLFYDQSAPAGLEWRDQLLVYRCIFGILGIVLISRYRGRRAASSGRFSWIRNLLFRSSSNKKRGGGKAGRRESSAAKDKSA